MIDEFDGNPFGPGIDYAVPPGPFGGGVIYVTLSSDEAPPGSTVYDQHGEVIGTVPDIDPGIINVPGQAPPVGVDTPPMVSDVIDPDTLDLGGHGPPIGDYEGGPEDTRAPPQFDIPTPTEPPVAELPQAGPIEGEYIPRERRGPVIFDDEGFPEFGYDRKGPYSRRQINVDPDAVVRDIMRGIGGRVARGVLGPYGSAIGAIFEPEVLGSGELPFPPIPQVSIPAPDVAFPSFPFGELSPPAPVIDHPAAPDVVVVTPEQPWPADIETPLPAPTGRSVLAPPSASSSSRPWWQIISGAVIAGAIGRARAPATPAWPAIDPGISPEIPASEPGLSTPPRDPLTPPAPALGTDPLTPVQGGVQTLTGSGFGPLVPSETTTETDDRCRCREKKPKKKKKSPSAVIAHLKPFDRRMSTYSLKNLRRGLRK